MKDDLEAKVVYVRDAPTKCQGRRYSLSDGESIRFPARPAPFHRKQFIISNISSVNLQIRVSSFAEHADPVQTPLTGTSAGALGGVVFPTSIIGIFTSDAIWIKAASGAANFDVLEVWYV
jgi:hypothetical protein